MFKRCGALVLGLLTLSASAALAQVTFPINNGAFYDPTTGGRTGYTVNYSNGVSNNVAVYQNQLMQTQQAYNGAYSGGAYNTAYNSAYTNTAYTMGYSSPYTTAAYANYTTVPTYTSYIASPTIVMTRPVAQTWRPVGGAGVHHHWHR